MHVYTILCEWRPSQDVQLSPHIPPSTVSQPTLQELQALPHDGQQINIVETIAAKWRAVGIALCLNRYRIDIIERDALRPNQTENACRAMLEYWMEGRGATWRALIRALEDVDENVLASQLKDALQ